jgi:hypothetical protein
MAATFFRRLLRLEAAATTMQPVPALADFAGQCHPG